MLHQRNTRLENSAREGKTNLTISSTIITTNVSTKTSKGNYKTYKKEKKFTDKTYSYNLQRRDKKYFNNNPNSNVQLKKNILKNQGLESNI